MQDVRKPLRVLRLRWLRDGQAKRFFAVEPRNLVVGDERFRSGESSRGGAVEEFDGDRATHEARHGALNDGSPPRRRVDVVDVDPQDHVAEIDPASIRGRHTRHAMSVAACNAQSYRTRTT